MFEAFRQSYGAAKNEDKAFQFLANRIRFSESLIFIATNQQDEAIGFVQLFPQTSSIQLQRYWQITDIFVLPNENQSFIFEQLINKSRQFVRFTQSSLLVVEKQGFPIEWWEKHQFKLNRDRQLLEMKVIQVLYN